MTDADIKKAARLNKIKFDTHVNLLMINGASKNDALVAAYIQGPGGLEKLQAPQVVFNEKTTPPPKS